MSSTKRGAMRRAHDYYPTPHWCVDRLLDVLRPLDGEYDILVEPCCGEGAIVDAVQARYNVHASACDIDEGLIGPFVSRGDGVEWLIGMRNARNYWPALTFWCITNPPYSDAMRFVQAAVETCDVVCMLLRLAWASSAKRFKWLQANTPSVWVLPNRPSFDGVGTDSADYAWFVWGVDDTPTFRVLDETPKSVRKAAKLATRRLLGLDS